MTSPPNRLGFSHEVHAASYSAIHQWMRKHFPLVGRCEWCGRTDKRTCYAASGHRYTRNRADWFEFCYSCHLHFDGGHEKKLEAMHVAAQKVWTGRKHSAETLAKFKEREITPEHRANMSIAQRKRWSKAKGF